MASRIVTLLLFFLAIAGAHAQGLLPESPLASSLAGSTVALPEVISFSANPAASRANSALPLRAAITYSPFIGGLKDANLSAAEAMYFSSLVQTSFTLGVTNLSYNDLYSDLAISVSLARQFSLANNRNVSAGIRLRYETLGTTPAYLKLHFFFLDLGFILDLTPEFCLGGAAINLLGNNYEIASGDKEHLDQRFLFGLAWHSSKLPVKVLTSLEQDQDQSLAFQFGLEYDPVKILALRIGTSTDTGNITAGIGLNYANIMLEAGSRFDKALGSLFSFGASGAWGWGGW